MRPGPHNSICDVHGVRVGHADNAILRSGSTVILADKPFTAAVHVMGGAPGTRETDLLAPHRLVQQVDAIVLSGGSAFGLDAASGVADRLAETGRGFAVGEVCVPIVPAAILFDLLNGGEKSWSDNPYKDLGRAAFDNAGMDCAIGSVGAGTGAIAATLKGGLGTASAMLPDGSIVGALVAVNSAGSVVQNNGPHFWAAPFEIDGEFGGLGSGEPDPLWQPVPPNPGARGATTIAVIATDIRLTQAQAKFLAVAAHDGIARSIVPAHTLYDGDLIFALTTAAREPATDEPDLYALSHAAATCLARAVARGVHAARSVKGDLVPDWHSVHASASMSTM